MTTKIINIEENLKKINDTRVQKILPYGKINCNLVNNNYSKEIELGEIMYTFYSKNTDHYFYDIVCPDIKLPLLSVTNFGSSKLIHITSDGVGANLLNFKICLLTLSIILSLLGLLFIHGTNNLFLIVIFLQDFHCFTIYFP